MNFTIKQPNPALNFRSVPQRRARTARIIIHHYHHERATPQDVHRWHLNNGWIGFGYNGAVDMDGTIWEGRGWDNVGTHTGYNNGDSIGIAVQGRFDDNTRQMPDAQYNALVWLIKHLRSIYGNIAILRHSDLNATACPGRFFPWEELLRLQYRGGVEAEPPIRTVTLDILGRVEDISGYIESGATWVRLTEMGAALGFEVSWDETRRIPVVMAPDGAVYTRQSTTNATDPPPTRHVAIDILGEVQHIGGYSESGATWVRLTEFVKALDFVAAWDVKRSIPVIKPSIPTEYTALTLDHVDEKTLTAAAEDITLLKTITHWEARGEDEKGQILVVNVIKNRLNSPRFPNSLREVIFAPGAFTPTQRADFDTASPNARTVAAVNRALEGADFSQGATFFHAISHLTPDAWHERAAREGRLVILFDHGNHRFYREA